VVCGPSSALAAQLTVMATTDTPPVDLSALSDGELSALAACVAAEQQMRAIAGADPDALVELGFAEGFKSDGLPRDPWLVAGVLICPGARNDRSATSHDCGFVTVGDVWVWEADERITDVIRQVPGPRHRMRSVTLLAAFDGLAVDLVVSRARSGMHQLRGVRSFEVHNAEVTLVGTRTPRRTDHR
jgi:hypothetical protein